MAERAYAQHHGHAFGLANLKEAAQVALSAPVEYALLLLDMVPKHIVGDDCHAAILHLPHLALPLVGGYSGVMHLAHHGHHALAAYDKAARIPLYFGHLRHKAVC